MSSRISREDEDSDGADSDEDETLGDDESDEDAPDDTASERRASSDWTALGRYLTSGRAAKIVALLDDEDIPYRMSLEGRSSNELNRIQVPAEQLEEAEEALFSTIEKYAPEAPGPSRYSGPLGRMRRRRELARAATELEQAFRDDDQNGAIAALWAMVAIDPEETSNRRRLVDLLLERDETGDTELARWWVEEVMRRYGVGAMAPEMASIAICEGSLDEAEAWLDEAETSGADPAEVAFEKCNLAFTRGILRELKQAAADFRRTCDVPDSNWIQVAAMLASANEIDRAGQMLGTTLRDSPVLQDDEWALAAALRMVAEGADEQSREELAELVGKADAKALEDEADDWLRNLRREWKRSIENSKKAKKGTRTGGRSKR